MSGSLVSACLNFIPLLLSSLAFNIFLTWGWVEGKSKGLKHSCFLSWHHQAHSESLVPWSSIEGSNGEISKIELYWKVNFFSYFQARQASHLMCVVCKPRFGKKKLNWHLPKAPLRRTRPWGCWKLLKCYSQNCLEKHGLTKPMGQAAQDAQFMRKLQEIESSSATEIKNPFSKANPSGFDWNWSFSFHTDVWSTVIRCWSWWLIKSWLSWGLTTKICSARQRQAEGQHQWCRSSSW